MPILVVEDPDPGEEDRRIGGWTPIPDQTDLAAEVLSVEDRVMPFAERDADGNDLRDASGEIVRPVWLSFTFVVTEPGQFKGRKVTGDVDKKLKRSPSNQLYQWSCALFGIDSLDKGFKLDTDKLVGMPCRILVQAKEGKKKGPNGETRIFNNVVDVWRVGAGGSLDPVSDEPF